MYTNFKSSQREEGDGQSAMCEGKQVDPAMLSDLVSSSDF